MERDGKFAGLEVMLNTNEGQSSDYGNVYGSGTLTLIEDGTEQSYPINITSGTISDSGELDFTTEESSEFYSMGFRGSMESDRIQGSVAVDSDSVSGGPFELDKGESGEKLFADAVKRAKEDQRQQQAASDLEELDSQLGGLLYSADEDSGFSSEPQSVEAAIGAVQSNATALEETLESTVGSDADERASDNSYVQEVLDDYRAGKTSAEDACEDLSYDRSEYSQFNGVYDESVEEYRQGRDTLQQSQQTLKSLIGNAKDIVEQLETAEENAPDDAPETRYGVGDLEPLESDAQEAIKQAESALSQTESQLGEQEEQAQEASDQAVSAYDEMGIENEADCYDLPDETSVSQSQDNQDTSGGSTSLDDGPLQPYVLEYYKVIGDEDWETMYSMLDSESQEVYTESEWNDLQEARENDKPLPAVSSVEISNVTEDGGITIVEAVLNPGTDNEADSIASFSQDVEGYHRYLTQADISYYDGL